MRKISIILATLALVSLLSITPMAQAQVVTGPYVDQLTFYAITDESIALASVSAGTADMYLWRVPIALREQARADPNLKLVTGFGGYLSLCLNPAPITSPFNPFSIKAVRQAVQYLIDRDYIINVLHKGDASPKIVFYGRYDGDYAYMADLGEAWLAKYTYNFDRANQLITQALTAAGATKNAAGKWTKDGTVITINGFIRSDDPIRTTIGDIFSNDLDSLGITVNRIYGTLTQAYDVVYGSDPIEGQWHFYTEGWRAGALTKYDEAGLTQMYAPWYGYMPGWQETGYWQYENDTIDDLTETFTGGQFTSLEDRANIIREVVQMGFEESVRLFIADQLEPYPYNAKFSPFSYELAVGPATPFAFKTLRNPATSDGMGGSFKIAQKLMYQGAYNPIRGFTDVYSVNIWNIINDPGVWPNPHTGIYMPIRAPYVVTTAGPTGKLDVPSTAETWNYTTHNWETLGAGKQATSKVVFDFKFSNWHHGVPMTVADTRYALYMVLEWATRGQEGTNDTRYDSEYAGVQGAFVDNFVGAKFVDNDTVEMYVNYWFPDENYIASFASIFPPLPWEVYFVSERVVQARQAAYSKSVATANGVPWLDFTAGDTPGGSLYVMKANFTEVKAANLIPEALTGYITSANATARYNALGAWVTAHNHFLVSNGCFYFDSTDRTAGQDVVKAFRDPTYPFKPGVWNYLVPVEFPSVSTEAPSTVVIGSTATANVKVAIGGTPSSLADVIYLVLDSSANVILKGDALPTSEIGTFQITLNSTQTSEFVAGGYVLKIIAYSRTAIIPRFDSKVFTALPPFEEIIGADIAQLRTDVTGVKDDVTALSDTTTDVQTRVSGLEGTIATLTTLLYIATILIVVSIVISGLMFFFMRRKS